jgi:NADPH2:quinone reductase
MEKLPAQMTVVGISKPGGPEVLVPETRAVPSPGPGEILVKVATAGVNRPDVAQRSGAYPPPPGASDLPGLEIAGEVVAVGPGATRHKLGDKVMSLVAGGGYAQYVNVPAVQCLPVPGKLSLEEAAALPETFFTVWMNVFERARLHRGETLLVHGGSSGIGTTAIMLAKACEARVIITAGSAAKCSACRELGADVAINYHETDFVEATLRATDGKGANVILDMVGGDYLARNAAAAALDGRIALIATQGGTKSELDLRQLMSKRLTISACTLRPQSVETKGRLAQALRQKVWPLFDSRGLKPVIHARFPLADAAGAHKLMEGSTHIGKIVLLT